MSLIKRALPQADWAIGAVDGSAVIEVRRISGFLPYKYIVVECDSDGTVRRVDSKRGMELERAKARATYLAGCF